jgi:outer membrane cobalamin receptor
MTIKTKAATMRLLQIALFPCLAAPLWAQESEVDALDEIVVTATSRS